MLKPHRVCGTIINNLYLIMIISRLSKNILVTIDHLCLFYNNTNRKFHLLGQRDVFNRDVYHDDLSTVQSKFYTINIYQISFFYWIKILR